MLTRRDVTSLLIAAPAGAAALPSVMANSAHAQSANAVRGTVAAFAPDLTEQEAAEIAEEAYIYAYPLVSMDITRRVSTNVPPGVKPGLGPSNAFQHMRAYPDANFKEVVRPNFDTLYSPVWLDLTREPMVISVPDTQGRYYLLPMIDMWSDVFAVPGKRTSGTKAGSFAVVAAGWNGKLPAGVQKIVSPTPYVWIIGRTQTNGPKDYAAVHKVQDAYTITPLSQWGRGGKVAPPKFVNDPTVDMKTPPLDQVNKMAALDYFKYVAELLKLHPPHTSDWSTIARLKRIGIDPGKLFDASAATPALRAALERGAAQGLKTMYAKVPTLARVANNWSMNTDTMGVYGNYYLKRAIVALVGLGANQPEDAVYPLLLSDAEGKPLTGEGKYVVHFEKGDTPPTNAFWSLTMYDEAGFQVANPIDRFAIGDRDALKFNADGSLDILIQNADPGADKQSNWLPAPASGVLGVTMRIYAPKASVLDGRWNPPLVRKVS
jgi:hypothetical protein